MQERSNIRFSPKVPRGEYELPFYRQPYYVVLAVLAVGMFFHIEVGIGLQHAPKNVLVQVVDPDGYAEEYAECFADIEIIESVGIKKRPLEQLSSVYDYIDPSAFFANTDRGFYLLDTGLTGSEEDFEIRIVCYAPDLEGVSYTIINDENQSECQTQEGGNVVIC